MRASFPHRLLWQDVTPRFVGASLEPQRSISGAETVIPAMGGHWEVTASFVLRDEAAQLQWQAFLAQMEGRIGTTLVPFRSRYRPRDRDGRALPACKTASLAGGQTWEHFGFESEPVGALILGAAALRATDLRFTVPVTGEGIRPGQFLSIGERAYRVQHHWQDETGRVIRVQPPLREAVPAGTPAVVDAPVCLMRFASETEGEFDHLLDRLPRVTCVFVEALSDVTVSSLPPDPGSPGVWDDNAVWG